MPTAAKKPATSPGKAVAPTKDKPGTTMVKSDVALEMLLHDAQTAQSQFNRDDLAIPFIRVLQKGSPQVNKRDELYIEGAEPGMFINTATGEIFDGENEGINVVVVSYTPSYIAWRPRSEGGGFVKDYGADASVLERTTKNDDGKDMLPDGTEVVRSGQYYVFHLKEGGKFSECVLALSGTQLKKSRKWNTMIKSLRIPRGDGLPGTFNPAPFYMVYNIKTVFEQNDKGDWMGVDVTPVGAVTTVEGGTEVYLAAREFFKSVQAGTVKVKHDETIVDEADVEVTLPSDDDKF